MADEIIFKDSSGQVLTKSDLNGFSGTASWEVLSEQTVSQEARDLHNAGREFGQKGDYANAIKNFELASEIDLKWAYPVYDLAYTYLLMGEQEKSHEYYLKVDSMEPRGFFNYKAAVYSLKVENDGVFPQGLYQFYLTVEWMDSAKKIQTLQLISKKYPKFAPVWKDLISFAADDKAALAFIDNGLAAEPDIDTYGILKVNKALILHRSDKSNEAIKILGELALNPNSSIATEKIAKQTLFNLLN